MKDTFYYLGIAEAQQGNFSASIKAIESFIANAPHDPNLPWLKQLLQHLKVPEGKKAGRRYALLIGIEDYLNERIPDLQGPGNDVRTLAIALGAIGFEVTTLRDDEATRDAIIESLNGFRASEPSDEVWIHFSGHGHTVGNGFLLPHDGHTNPDRNSIGAGEFHGRLEAIPAHVTVLLDTAGNEEFLSLAQASGAFRVLSAAAAGKQTYEAVLDGKHYGAFSWSLSQQLSSLSDTTTFGEFFSKVGTSMRGKQRSFAVSLTMVGRQAEPLFLEDNPLRALEYFQPKSLTGVNAGELASLYRELTRNRDGLPLELHRHFGSELMRVGDYSLAVSAFDACSHYGVAPEIELLLQRSIAELKSGQSAGARNTFTTVKTKADRSEIVTAMDTAIQSIDRLALGKSRHAVVVGIDDYQNIRKSIGAVNDARAMAVALQEQLEFSEVQVLENRGATSSTD